jgi:hypothetical protein
MADDPFERFGIKALSPSMLNAFQHSPAHWAVKYLMKVKDESSPNAFRGNAVEHGLNAYFRFQKDEKATEIALNEALRSFDTSCGGAGLDIADEDVQKERGNISGMLTQALTVYYGDAPPLSYQLKVEDWIDEAEVSIIGYIDFIFAKTVDDLKTVKSMPSKPTAPHLRQFSLYARNRKEKPRLVYVTGKKASVFDLPMKDLHDAWDTMVRDACAMRHLLSKAETPLDVVRMLSVDHTDYVWSAPTLQAAFSAHTHIALTKGASNGALVAAERL